MAVSIRVLLCANGDEVRDGVIIPYARSSGVISAGSTVVERHSFDGTRSTARSRIRCIQPHRKARISMLDSCRNIAIRRAPATQIRTTRIRADRTGAQACVTRSLARPLKLRAVAISIINDLFLTSKASFYLQQMLITFLSFRIK